MNNKKDFFFTFVILKGNILSRNEGTTSTIATKINANNTIDPIIINAISHPCSDVWFSFVPKQFDCCVKMIYKESTSSSLF